MPKKDLRKEIQERLESFVPGQAYSAKVSDDNDSIEIEEVKEESLIDIVELENRNEFFIAYPLKRGFKLAFLVDRSRVTDVEKWLLYRCSANEYVEISMDAAAILSNLQKGSEK